MKLELKRQDFLKAWQTVEKTASSKTAMANILNSIKINASFDGTVTLEATDLRTTVKCKAEGVAVIEPGTAVLPVTVISGMLKKSKSDVLTLELGNTKGTLNAEGSKSRFPLIPLDSFPNVPESSGAEILCEVLSTELSRVITEGSTASSQPQDFPKYIGACLLRTTEHSLKAVSTDGKRLSVSEVFCSVKKQEDVMLPANALKELAKQLMNYEESVKILSDSSTQWFSLESVEFSVRKIEAAFPEYERILSNEVYTVMRTPCDKLMSAVERVDIIARTTIPHLMVVDMKPDSQLKLTAKSPDYGVTGEFLEIEISGNPLKTGFNAAYFLEGLRALGTGDIEIEFSGPEGQTRMTRKDDSSFLYMLMPSRLSPQDFADDELEDNAQPQNEAEESQTEESQSDEPHEEYNEDYHEDYNEEYHEGEDSF